VVFTAERAEWRDGAWWFYGKTEQKYGPDERRDGPLAGPEPGPVPMPGLAETPDYLLAAMRGREIEKYSPSLAVLRYVRQRTAELAEWRRAAGGAPADPAAEREWAIKEVDAHTRLAMPLACLVASLLAIPAGTRGGRQGVIAGIMFAVALFLGFYLTNQVAVFMGKTQVLRPWLGAWLANFVFFGVGLVMISRVRT